MRIEVTDWPPMVCTRCFWRSSVPGDSGAWWCAHKAFAGWLVDAPLCDGKEFRENTRLN